MIFYVYILHSSLHDKIYIGFASNLENRIPSHNSLATKGYTVRFRPWTLIYTEEFDNVVIRCAEKDFLPFHESPGYHELNNILP